MGRTRVIYRGNSSLLEDGVSADSDPDPVFIAGVTERFGGPRMSEAVVCRYIAWARPCTESPPISLAEDCRLAELKKVLTTLLHDLELLNYAQLRQIMHRIERLIAEIKRKKNQN